MDIEAYLIKRIEDLTQEMQRQMNAAASTAAVPYSSAIGELQAALDQLRKKKDE